jgi:hypothetical protein
MAAYQHAEEKHHEAKIEKTLDNVLGNLEATNYENRMKGRMA